MSKEALKSTGKITISPLTKFLSWFIPSGSRKSLSKALKFSKYEFGTQYYKNMLQEKGLVNRAPKDFQVSNNSASLTVESLLGGYKCQGGFNPFSNSICFTNEFRSLPKRIQAELLSHELKHFEQIDNVIRTFGIEKYIEALKKQTFNTLRSSAQYKGMADDTLIKFIEDDWTKNNAVENIIKAFQKSIEAERILPDSKLGHRAKIYLDAIENYTGLKNDGLLLEVSNAYRKNALEQEAYKTGSLSNIYTLIMQGLQF